MVIETPFPHLVCGPFSHIQRVPFVVNSITLQVLHNLLCFFVAVHVSRIKSLIVTCLIVTEFGD